MLGVLHRDDGIVAPSRHLGLVPAAERDDAAHALDRLADRIAQAVDLEQVVRLAHEAPGPRRRRRGRPTSLRPASAVRSSPWPADARSRSATPRPPSCSTAAGCDVVTFDPLTDEALPDGTAGLYLGGGFPEVHAAGLSANAPLRAALLDAVQAGRADGRRVRRPALPVPQRRRRTDGRRDRRGGPHDAAPHPRLPHRRHIRGPPARRRRHPRSPATSSTGPSSSPPTRSPPTPCTPPTCTPTGPATPRWPAASPPPPTRRPNRRQLIDGESPARTTPSEARPRAARREHADPLRHHGDAELERGAGRLRGQRARRAAAGVARRRPCGRASTTSATTRMPARPRRRSPDGTVASRPRCSPPPARPRRSHSSPGPATGRDRSSCIRSSPSRTSRSPLAGQPPEHVLLDAGAGFALDPALVPDDADLVVVGNPTNPTSVLHPESTLRALARPGRIARGRRGVHGLRARRATLAGLRPHPRRRGRPQPDEAVVDPRRPSRLRPGRADRHRRAARAAVAVVRLHHGRGRDGRVLRRGGGRGGRRPRHPPGPAPRRAGRRTHRARRRGRRRPGRAVRAGPGR